MEAQLIRYRATRKYVFGVLNIGEFECFTKESREELIEAGAYDVTLSDYAHVVRIGDTVVTHDRFKNTGSVRVGCTINSDDNLEEEIATGMRLVKEINKGQQEDSVNLEIIDEADYNEADSELT